MYKIPKKSSNIRMSNYIRLSLTKLRFIFALDVESLKSLFSGSSGHFETVDATGRVGGEFHPHYVVPR